MKSDKQETTFMSNKKEKTVTKTVIATGDVKDGKDSIGVYESTVKQTFSKEQLEHIITKLVKQESDFRMGLERLEEEQKNSDNLASEWHKLQRLGVTSWQLPQWQAALKVLNSMGKTDELKEQLQGHRDALLKIKSDLQELERLRKELE